MSKLVNMVVLSALWAYSLPNFAHAQPGPSTTEMPCASVARLVATRGAVVLSTGRNTYEHYVANGDACDRGQGTEPAFERTYDAAQCFIVTAVHAVLGVGGETERT
jgi:hypothetical protein